MSGGLTPCGQKSMRVRINKTEDLEATARVEMSVLVSMELIFK